MEEEFILMNEAYYAFDLRPVAPATDTYKRRSEATLAELNDGTCLLAYANHTDRSDNDKAFIEGAVIDRTGEPTGERRMLVAPPENGLNAMSPALKRLPDGRLGMLYSYRIGVKEACRHFIASEDEGRSWSAPVIVGEGEYKTGCHDRFAVHSSGRLLAPLHCTDDWDKHHLHVRVAYSDDGGNNWTLGEPVELPYVRWPDGRALIESGCIEPGIAERTDGSLLMTIRTAMGTQFCSESFDAGRTWSRPRSMEVSSPQAPAHLSRVPGTGDLLLVWTPSCDPGQRLGGKRNTIVTCVSSDGGRSWPFSRRKLLVHEPEHSVDYPSVLYKDGEAWITLRASTGSDILEGRTSTCLMRVPLHWFYSSSEKTGIMEGCGDER